MCILTVKITTDLHLGHKLTMGQLVTTKTINVI